MFQGHQLPTRSRWNVSPTARIPPEVLCRVFEKLSSGHDALSCSMVNRQWRAVIKSNDKTFRRLAYRLSTENYLIMVDKDGGENATNSNRLGPWFNACVMFAKGGLNLVLKKPLEVKKRQKAESVYVNSIPAWFGSCHMTMPLLYERQQPATDYRSTIYVQTQAYIDESLDVTEIDPHHHELQVHQNAKRNIDGAHQSGYGTRYTRRLPNRLAVHFMTLPKEEVTQWFSRYYLLFSSMASPTDVGRMRITGVDVDTRQKLDGVVEVPSSSTIRVVQKSWLLAEHNHHVYLVLLPEVKLVACKRLPKSLTRLEPPALAGTASYILYYSSRDDTLMACPVSRFQTGKFDEIALTPLLKISKIKPKHCHLVNLQCSERFICLALNEEGSNKAYLVVLDTFTLEVKLHMYDYDKGSIPKGVDDTFRSFTLSGNNYLLECPGLYWVINSRGQVIHLTQSVIEAVSRSYKVRGRSGPVAYDSQYIR